MLITNLIRKGENDMEIKDLKINDEVSVKVSTQRLRDTDDEK